MSVFLVPIILYAGNVLLNIPLSFVGWAALTAAVTGLVFGAVLEKRRSVGLKFNFGGSLHPVVILAVLFLFVAVVTGGFDYLPYPGDETASWLRYAKQIFLADAYLSEKLAYHHGAYTNGWPLMIALPNLFAGSYSDANAAALPFIMHVGILGASYDLVLWVARTRSIGSEYTPKLIAWLTVLVLVSAEALWILFPTFQLIDKPILYALAGAFLLAVIGQYQETNRRILSAYLGVVICAGYLLKVTMIAFLPSLGIMWAAFTWMEYKIADGTRAQLAQLYWKAAAGAAIMAGLMLVPFIVTYLTWQQFRFGHECNASATALTNIDPSDFVDEFIIVFFRMAELSAAYAGEFKLTATALALPALVIGVSFRRFWILGLAFLIFFVFYLTALNLVYVTCQPFLEIDEVQSFQRYFRPNLRLIHFFGPLILLLAAFEAKRIAAFINYLFKMRAIRAAGITVAVILLAFQGFSVNRSLTDINNRKYQDPAIRKSITQIKRESESLTVAIRRSGLDSPRISLVAQGGYGVEIDLASYFGIKTRRDKGAYFNYEITRPFSWGPTRSSAFTLVTTQRELEAWWRGFDIIWPVRTDEWTRSVLARLVGDSNCAANPEQFFIIKGKGEAAYRCVAK